MLPQSTKVQSCFSYIHILTHKEMPPMKHPDTRCDCAAPASPLALRWRCPACGKTAIMRVSTLAAVCDGDTMRKVEPEVASHQSAPGS
jgi:hypothetical protein